MLDMMTISEFEDESICARALAAEIAVILGMYLETSPQTTLALSGGRSPQAVLPVLAKVKIDWSKVNVTLVDDRWVPPEHGDSNTGMVQTCFCEQGAAAATFVPLWSDVSDPKDGIRAANNRLNTLPWPIDIAYLGMGPDGHIASLFPTANVSNLSAREGRLIAATSPKGTRHRISMDLPSILSSRTVFLHATGAEKRAVFERAKSSAPSPELPVSLLLHSGHEDLRVYMAA